MEIVFEISIGDIGVQTIFDILYFTERMPQGRDRHVSRWRQGAERNNLDADVWSMHINYWNYHL